MIVYILYLLIFLLLLQLKIQCLVGCALADSIKIYSIDTTGDRLGSSSLEIFRYGYCRDNVRNSVFSECEWWYL